MAGLLSWRHEMTQLWLNPAGRSSSTPVRLAKEPAVKVLVSQRKDLRFRPLQPENLVGLMPRQHREFFEASRVSTQC